MDPLAVFIPPGIGAENTYRYAAANPVVKRDPLGLYAEFWCTSPPRKCPDLGKYIKEVLEALEDEKCMQAVDSVGCGDFMRKMKDPTRNPLQGITIYCKDLSPRESGHCTTRHDITVDCEKRDPAATIIHELTHAWAFNAGQKPDPKGPWKCGTCGYTWPNADPIWEGHAEHVKHTCFPRS